MPFSVTFSFISTLLTATLTHHLGWVGSVAPIPTATRSGSSQLMEAAVRDQQAKRSEISKTHPYNALWAQMSDLYGAIGHPPKISRTIVVGKGHATMDKILHMLTYFIRCGDIRKSGDGCALDRQGIDCVMANVEAHLVDLDTTPSGSVSGEGVERTCLAARVGDSATQRSSLYRSASHMSSLNELAIVTASDMQVLTKNVMNDIPNVIAYRDSRFVKQELRIGNHLMDTGREMDKQQFRAVKLLVTSPENELIDVEEGVEVLVAAEEGQQMRRNDSAPMLLNRSLSALITENSMGSTNTSEATKLLWGVEPVKQGIDSDQWRHWARGIEISEEKRFAVGGEPGMMDREGGGNKEEEEGVETFMRRNLFTKSEGNHLPRSYSHQRRSKMARRRGSGQGGMLELREEEPELEGEMFTSSSSSRHHNDVVFVLGDNDELVNLRQFQAGTQQGQGDAERKGVSTAGKQKTPCCGHKAKKHSGVKFNFEQYPQIVENYMRNKNFAMEGSEILAKAIKMERAAERLGGGDQEIHSRAMEALLRNVSSAATESGEEEEECECCAGFKATRGLLQTPSNASELDLEWDNYSQMPGTSSSSSSTQLGKQSVAVRGAVPKQPQQPLAQHSLDNSLRVVALPMPNVEESRGDDTVDALGANSFPATSKWGMVPSLMLGVTDHYVPDMVLQGIRIETQQQQLTWEVNLRQDLTLSAHCATIEQVPTENVAIVANVDDWEVRIVSSNGASNGANAMSGGGGGGGTEKDTSCLFSYSTSGERRINSQ